MNTELLKLPHLDTRDKPQVLQLQLKNRENSIEEIGRNLDMQGAQILG
jgi:hypothetical protein